MNKTFLTSFGLFFSLMTILSFPMISSAQTSNSQVTSNSNMTIEPVNPKFGDTINASVKNIYRNLNEVEISWYVDGVLKKEGIGMTSFSFDLSKNYQAVTVKAKINLATSIDEVEKTVQPRDLDIIFEPQSYTPYFYKGSPLYAKNGTVKIIALPSIFIDDQKISDSNLTYTWMKNGIVDGNASGRGKNTYIFSGNGISDDTDIDLTVQDDNKKITAERITSLSPANSKILMYEDSPLYGILFNKALTGVVDIGSKEEMGIIAFPFNFDVSTPDSSDLTITWSINGKNYSTSGRKNAIVLRQAETSGSGSSNINMSIENNARIFQFGNFSFTLKYEK